MSTDLNVLRALLRLARSGASVTTSHLLDRVDADAQSLEEALSRLVQGELVLRTPSGPRLTLAGLAVAASTIAPVMKDKKPRTSRPKPAARMATVLPLVRRHRAA